MSKTIEIGKRVVPVEQIALIEPFDPETQKNMRSTRPFRARLVLLNRDSILSEIDPLDLAETLEFRMLPKENVATNPSIHFNVERFEPTPDFQPSKPFVSGSCGAIKTAMVKVSSCSRMPKILSRPPSEER